MQPRMVEALSLGVVTVIDWLPSRSLDRRRKHENPESVKLSKFSHLEFVEFQNPFCLRYFRLRPEVEATDSAGRHTVFLR